MNLGIAPERKPHGRTFPGRDIRARPSHRFACLASLLLLLHAIPAQARWWKYEGCRLVEHPSNDGDSFHVRTKSADFIFRLCFVDCPETDPSFPDRLREQAEYWRIDQETLSGLAVEAADFTREFLAGEFTVYSQRESAMGRSAMGRFYAVVMVGDRSLDEELVSRGLARLYGRGVDRPTGESEEEHWKKLRSLETKARQRKAGGWAGSTSVTPAMLAEASKSVGQERILCRSLPFHTADAPRVFHGLVSKGSRVRILRAEADGWMRIRHTNGGRITESLCSERDLSLSLSEGGRTLQPPGRMTPPVRP